MLQAHNKQKTNSVWHFKGTRPANFPTIRLKQFAQFASSFNFDTSIIYLSATEIIDEFNKLVHDFWLRDYGKSKKINQSFSNSLIINAVIPLVFYIGNREQDERMSDKAIALLELLPAEKNRYIEKWNKCNVIAKNAFDSQSLLSLYQYYCSRKKCLTCGVGNKLLED